MEVLLDKRLNINYVSQEVLVAWPLILPVIYNETTTLITVLKNILNYAVK